MYFGDGDGSIMDVAGGFTSLSFYYSEYIVDFPGFVTVFSGAGGTGTALGTINLPKTNDGVDEVPCVDVTGANYCPFVQSSVAFSGTALSAVFGGTANTIVFDNIQYNAPAATPEPGTWLLLTAGLLTTIATKKRSR
jgi:hypothetical protein